MTLVSSYHIRRKGIVYASIGAGLLGVAGVLNRPALAALGAIALLLVALQSTRPRSSSISLDRNMGEDIRRVEGDTLAVGLDIRTSSRVTRLVEVLDDVPPVAKVTSGSNYQVVGLRRDTPRAMAYSATVPVFGHHSFGPTQLRVEDPFGFYGTDLSLPGEAWVAIEPRPSSLDATQVRSIVPQSLLGQYEVSQPGSGFDFFGLRDYNPSDRMRDVNWKATSRVRRLVVNQHVKESRADVLILIDARDAELVGHPVHCAFRQSGRIAVEVTEELLRRRDSLRIVFYGEKVHELQHTGNSRKLRGLIEELMIRSPQGSYPLTQVVADLLPTIALRSPVVLFSSLLDDPDSDRAVTQLLSQGNRLLVFSPTPVAHGAASDADEALLLAEREKTVHAIRSFGCTVVSTDPPAAPLQGAEN